MTQLQAGSILTLHGTDVYQKSESGWVSMRRISSAELLELVKPEHREMLGRNLARLHPDREITITEKVLLDPDARSISLKRAGESFYDPAVRSDSEMESLAAKSGMIVKLTIQVEDLQEKQKGEKRGRK